MLSPPLVIVSALTKKRGEEGGRAATCPVLSVTQGCFTHLVAWRGGTVHAISLRRRSFFSPLFPRPRCYYNNITTFGPGSQQESRPNSTPRRRRAFLEFEVDGAPVGRVEFELASDLLPVTCENFLRLCNGVLAPARPRPVLRYAGESNSEDTEGGGSSGAVEQRPDDEAERILCYEGTQVRRGDHLVV